MSKNVSSVPNLTASEVANYVVCPEAWRIKRKTKQTVKISERQIEGGRIRSEWLAETDLWARLRLYAKVAYCLLAILAIVVFLLEGRRIRQPDFYSIPNTNDAVSNTEAVN